MKTLKNIFFLLLTIALVSCDGNDLDFDDKVATSSIGGLLTIDKGLISYVVGNNATYTASGSAYQGNTQVTSVNIFKSFTNVAGETSNKNMLGTIAISDLTVGQSASFSQDFTYEDLINGLSIAGTALPTSDGELSIGDFFTLSYESLTSSGNLINQPSVTKVSVGTRFAGTYTVIDSDYWRINVQSGGSNWIGEERVIESVDATTYRHLGVGPFDPETVVAGFGYAVEESHLYFSITDNDTLNYEDVGNTTLLEVAYMSCVTNPSEFNNVPCGTSSNYVVRDDVDGKDIIYMTYGYLTPGSGPREFYEVLEKIVE